MKKLFFFVAALLAVAACIPEYEQMLNDASRAGKPGEDEFYATVEDTGSADPQTKVYADEQMRVLWNAGDTISIFKKTTLNRPYRFTGPEGSNAGGFTELPNSDEFITENPLNYNYAIYPYRKETVMSYDGVLTVDMPEVQVYKEHSFGMGANTMVSVTEDNILQFKNAGGYLSFKFYGDGVSVKSITLKGNNHEKLAGAAKVTMNLGSMPVVAMQSTATEEIALVCAEPVALGVDSENYTEFWFVVPPTKFTSGFTVTVTDKKGGVFTTSTTSEVSVTRNNLSRMAPMEVVPEYQYVPFADANFKAYCVQWFDKDSDGEISYAEASIIESISVSTADIESLQGIEFMPNLRYLECSGRNISIMGKLTSLDVSQNTLLESLTCSENQLTSLNVSNNTALTYLYCSNNQLTNLSVSNNITLTYLYCDQNKLSGLDVSHNAALATLICSNNQLTSLDVSQNTSLVSLACSENQLTSLDVSNNTAISDLYCDNNQLTSLDVSQNTALWRLSCSRNQLTSLDVSNNTALTYLYCSNNQLTNLSVSNNTAICELYCDNNQLTSLDVSHDSKLRYLDCSDNQLMNLSVCDNTAISELYCDNNQLTSLDVSQNTALWRLSCSRNQLTSLDVSKNSVLMYFDCSVNQLTSLFMNQSTVEMSCSDNQLTSLDVSQCRSLQSLNCSNNQLTSLDVSKNIILSGLYCINNSSNLVISIRGGQIFRYFEHDYSVSIVETGEPIPQGNITFADSNFKAYCVNDFDINKDGEISYAEALLILEVDCDNQNITSLAGIEFFANIEFLNCMHNLLTDLDVSQNTALQALWCSSNQLTSLDISHNVALVSLQCSNNQLTSLDVSHNTSLIVFNCVKNQLTTLDLSHNTAIRELYCNQNQLTSLDVGHNTTLNELYCYNNQLTSLDVSQTPSLWSLQCYNNQLTTLDVSNNAALTYLRCYGNPNLAEIWLKTNQIISNFNYDSNITTIKYKE